MALAGSRRSVAYVRMLFSSGPLNPARKRERPTSAVALLCGCTVAASTPQNRQPRPDHEWQPSPSTVELAPPPRIRQNDVAMDPELTVVIADAFRLRLIRLAPPVAPRVLNFADSNLTA